MQVKNRVPNKIKVEHVTYSPYKYEVNRTKTHENKACQNRPFFNPPHCMEQQEIIGEDTTHGLVILVALELSS